MKVWAVFEETTNDKGALTRRPTGLWRTSRAEALYLLEGNGGTICGAVANVTALPCVHTRAWVRVCECGGYILMIPRAEFEAADTSEAP